MKITVNNLAIATTVLFAFAVQTFGQDVYVSPQGHAAGQRMKQTLGAAFKSAKQKDFDGFLAAAAERYIQHSPDLPDGWKPVWDLLAKRPAGFSSEQMTWLGQDGFLDNDNYLVMLREVNRGDGTPASKIVDIMLFDEDGKYAEHWDIRQALSGKTASGRRETGAADEFVNNPVNYPVETEEANKKTAVEFLELAFNQGKLEEALDKFVSETYVQHNPLIPDGSAPVKEIFASGTIPPLKYDVQLVTAQNDLVVVFSKVMVESNPMAVVDILRVRDGKLVEHWDVLEPVPPAEEMPHTNGMFLRPVVTTQGDETMNVANAFMGAMGNGDMETMVSLMHDDMVWQNEGDSSMPWIGPWKSKKVILEEFFPVFGANFKTIKWEPDDALSNGDTAAYFGRMVGLLTKSNQETKEFTYALRVKVKDGKVILWNWFEDSFEVSRAFHGK